MEKSLFFDVSAMYMPMIKKVIELVNGKRGAQPYLFETMLRTEFSPTQKWDSASVNTNYVAADIVDMDSPLPVKRRDSLSVASGDLPTMGMKLTLTNKQINEINVMIAQGALAEDVAKKVLNDAVRCANGIKERIEACFLQALSEGAYAVDDNTNTGTGIRLDFKFPKKNCYSASTPWGEQGATPVSDIARVIEANPGITTILIAKETYNVLRRSAEARELVAGFNGVSIAQGGSYPTPSPTALNEAFEDEFGTKFQIIDRNVVIEKNGERKTIRPWNRDKVTFLADTQVGALVYGQLPEETHKVAGVLYEKPLEYALMSKYSTNDPLTEYTAIQGIVAPILENVDQIYSLDVSAGEVVDTAKEAQDAGDTKLTVWGATYVKSDVVKELAYITGARIAHNIGDSSLIAKINELNDAEEEELKARLNTKAKATPSATLDGSGERL